MSYSLPCSPGTSPTYSGRLTSYRARCARYGCHVFPCRVGLVMCRAPVTVSGCCHYVFASASCRVCVTGFYLVIFSLSTEIHCWDAAKITHVRALSGRGSPTRSVLVVTSVWSVRPPLSPGPRYVRCSTHNTRCAPTCFPHSCTNRMHYACLYILNFSKFCSGSWS